MQPVRPKKSRERPGSLGRVELCTAMSSTHRFYEDRAQEYFQRTASADLSHLYEVFLPHVAPGGRILDVGCGSGRDLRACVQRGFRAMGIDGSTALTEMARSFSGAECVTMRIEEMGFDQQFEGVWACASLLHVPRTAIDNALDRIHHALVPGGVLFASVQEGEGERVADDGRFYALYQEAEFLRRVEAAKFHILESWVSQDVLDQRRPIQWLNVLAKRT